MKRTRTDSTVYALRFNGRGRRQYVTLGSSKDGWTQAKAQTALQDELAKVQLGTWTPPEPEPAPTVERDPTFSRVQLRLARRSRARVATKDALGL